MAVTWASRRLRNIRRVNRAVDDQLRSMAADIAAIVLRHAGEDGLISDLRSTRRSISERMWASVIKPLFVGPGNEAIIGGQPMSPFTRLIRDGVEEATRIAIGENLNLLRKWARDDDIYNWLVGSRPPPVREMGGFFRGRITELTLDPTADRIRSLIPTGGAPIDQPAARSLLVRPRPGTTYDPWHEWVDPNGYRLSDRVWRTAVDVRRNIERHLNHHISQGTSAIDIATSLEQYLTPGAAVTRTSTPYGDEGSYAARRLARTEITAASGRATINAAQINPFAGGIRWHLSPSHPRIDICDERASGGPNGDGVYPASDVPQYPPHPHCLCYLTPEPRGDLDELRGRLKEAIQGVRGQLIRAVTGDDMEEAEVLRGILNPQNLLDMMMEGQLDEFLNDAALTVRRSVLARKASQTLYSASAALDLFGDDVVAAAKLTRADVPSWMQNDPYLGKITELQGFDGLPDVVNAANMDDLIANQGYTQVFRGISGSTPKVVEGRLEQFRRGDFYMGLGMFGNGTYSATEYITAIGYAYGDERGVIRMGIRPDARRIGYKDLMRMGSRARDDFIKRSNEIVWSKSGAEQERLREDYDRVLNTIWGDPGRYAATLGYDVIWVEEENYYVILNRTSVAMEEGWYVEKYT